MGAKVKNKLGHYKDEIDIVTKMVEEATDGIEKASLIDTIAKDTSPGRRVWIGLKIDQRQEVKGLSVDGKIWVDDKTSLDGAASDQFRSLMPPRQGEKWVAFEVHPGNLPHTRKFETKLKLNQHVVSDPDAQVVAIAVCYVPEGSKRVERKDLLLGHSLVPSPRLSASGAKKRD